MDSQEARRQLLELVDRGLVLADRDRGGRTYRLQSALPRAERVSSLEDRVVASLQAGPKTIEEIAELTELDTPQVRNQLRKLRHEGRAAIVEGGRGHRITRWALVGPQLTIA